MASASRDANRVPSLLAISNADGRTALPVFAHPTDHGLIVGTSSGTMPPDNQAELDANHVHSILAVSSVDHVTPVSISLNSVTNGLFVEYH